MSPLLIARRLDRLLERPEGRIVLLTGAWGVGKTYQWRSALERYKKKSPAEVRDGISYVSLFGLASLEDLRRRIAEEAIAAIRLPGSAETVGDQVSARGWKVSPWQILKVLPALPLLSKLDQLASDLLFNSVRDAVVCLDDLERQRHLRLSDVLGMASFLKEERNCRVLLLTNPEKLQHEGAEDLDRFLEKVVDEKLTLEPTPEESATIAVGDVRSPGTTILLERLAALAVTNVRVIRKLNTLATELELVLRGQHHKVLYQAVSTLALYGVSQLTPKPDFPSLEYLKHYGSHEWAKYFVDLTKDKAEQDPKQNREKAWSTFLQDYGYTNADDLDLEVAKALERGFVDKDAITEPATALTEEFGSADRRELMKDVWKTLSETWEPNTDEILGACERVVREAGHLIGQNDMHSLYGILRELSGTERANATLERFIEANQHRPAIFNLENDHFGDITNPEFRERLATEAKRHEAPLSLETALNNLADDKWGRESLGRVAGASVDELYKAIRAARGETLRRWLRGLRAVGRVQGDEAFPVIWRKAEEALRTIEDEGGLNAFRVARILPPRKQ